MQLRHPSRLIALALFAGVILGCSAGEEGDAPGGTSTSRKALSPEAAKLAATMVRAVSPDPKVSLVDVKFEIAQRPEVGKPCDVRVALIPTERLDRLFAKFQAGEAMELDKGETTEQISRPAAGTPILHTVTVTPKRDGIFTLTAVVLMDTQQESISRSFAIPVIAGSGLPEWTPKQAVARTTQ